MYLSNTCLPSMSHIPCTQTDIKPNTWKKKNKLKLFLANILTGQIELIFLWPDIQQHNKLHSIKNILKKRRSFVLSSVEEEIKNFPKSSFFFFFFFGGGGGGGAVRAFVFCFWWNFNTLFVIFTNRPHVSLFCLIKCLKSTCPRIILCVAL